MNEDGISVVILTYNRSDILADNLRGLSRSAEMLREIIVVDNSSDDVTGEMVRHQFPTVKYVHNEVNTGVAGRNRGLQLATGDIVVTLDDDVLGMDPDDFGFIADAFAQQDDLGGLCFRVLHYQTLEVCNWCHHRKREEVAMDRFPTYEITEGAVAFRRSAVAAAGGYFEGFFISHEGKDLAYRLMNNGFSVEYDGRVDVIHQHAVSGRKSWRRYYFDTRNAIWLAVRNMPVGYGLRFVGLTMCAMAVYSARDGYLKYWSRAVWDGLRGLPEIRGGRTTWSESTRRRIREIERSHPGFFYMVGQRLFRRRVEI